MTKFNIILVETVSYEIDIEAKTAEEAEEEARELWGNCDAAAQQKHFAVWGDGVEVLRTELTEDITQ